MERAKAVPDNFWVFGNDKATLIPGAAMFVRVPAEANKVEPFRPYPS
jgi:hypothetical protein